MVFVALRAKRTFLQVLFDLQISNQIQFAVYIAIDQLLRIFTVHR